MRNPYVAALVGTLACVSVEGFVMGAWAPPGAGDLGGWIIVCAFYTGPGALLLAIPYAHALEDQLERGASRGRVLALGTLGGAPVGLINVMATFFVLALLGGASNLVDRAESSSTNPDSIPILAAALFGGAALGLGCAWWISRPAEEDA